MVVQYLPLLLQTRLSEKWWEKTSWAGVTSTQYSISIIAPEKENESIAISKTQVTVRLNFIGAKKHIRKVRKVISGGLLSTFQHNLHSVGTYIWGILVQRLRASSILIENKQTAHYPALQSALFYDLWSHFNKNFGIDKAGKTVLVFIAIWKIKRDDTNTHTNTHTHKKRCKPIDVINNPPIKQIYLAELPNPCQEGSKYVITRNFQSLCVCCNNLC